MPEPSLGSAREKPDTRNRGYRRGVDCGGAIGLAEIRGQRPVVRLSLSAVCPPRGDPDRTPLTFASPRVGLGDAREKRPAHQSGLGTRNWAQKICKKIWPGANARATSPGRKRTCLERT